EVLITLGIIGVVAAMTIPGLMTKYKDKMFALQWRKSFSELAQAVRMMQENEDTIASPSGQADYEYELASLFGKYVKHGKICHSNALVSEGCSPQDYPVSLYNGSYKYGNMGRIDGGTTCMSLLNGSLVCFDYYVAIVDVNGYSKPNTIGRDIFAAHVNVDNYSINPAKGRNYSWGIADGVRVKVTNGDGTCKKTNDDYGWGCSYYYLHNLP
ncbi:MAG: hypothetical protein NC191_04985, partial [Muribaculaceae bacterium]|nr:hypothetical protein [Muribaculaceae bacterium]